MNDIVLKSLLAFQELPQPYHYSATEEPLNALMSELDAASVKATGFHVSYTNRKPVIELVRQLIVNHVEQDRYKAAFNITERRSSISENMHNMAVSLLRDSVGLAKIDEKYDAIMKLYIASYQRVWGKEKEGDIILKEMISSIKNDVPQEKRATAAIKVFKQFEWTNSENEKKLNLQMLQIVRDNIVHMPDLDQYETIIDIYKDVGSHRDEVYKKPFEKSIVSIAKNAISLLPPERRYKKINDLKHTITSDISSKEKEELDRLAFEAIDYIPAQKRYKAYMDSYHAVKETEKFKAEVMEKALGNIVHIPEEDRYNAYMSCVHYLKSKNLKQAALEKALEIASHVDESTAARLAIDVFNSSSLHKIESLLTPAFQQVVLSISKAPDSLTCFEDSVWAYHESDKGSQERSTSFMRAFNSMSALPEDKGYALMKDFEATVDEPDWKALVRSKIISMKKTYGIGVTDFLNTVFPKPSNE